VAEQFGVERGDHVRWPADPFTLGDEPSAHHLDEIGDVPVDGMIGACGIVRRFGIRRDVIFR
jgi:hypothetical protein